MIKEHRIKLGLTQEKLAEELNISTRQLQRIEKDETKTTIDTLIKIKNILKIPDKEMIKIFYK
jgi:transcriptional regulator with XRE-family HTH domain